MSFTLSDIIVENSIRRVLSQFRAAAQMADKTIIGALVDNLFDFTATGQQVRSIGPDGKPLANTQREGGIGSAVSNKYLVERDRLISFFENTEVAIVHSFSDVQVHLPCVSIQLAADGEDQGLALTDDFGGIGGLDVITDTNAALGQDVNTIHANAVVNVGIHTKEQLVTKYLYHVVKYAILSNKEELIRQNFIIATFKGSDFTRDAGWQGDHVYTRFLNISGKTEDSWVNVDELVVEGVAIDLNLLVPNDVASGTPITANTPVSQSTETVAAGSTTIQVSNSYYLPASGNVRIVTRDGFGTVISEETIILTGNNINTNIITTSTGLVFEHLVIINNDPAIARSTTIVAGDTTVFVFTIQPAPTSPSTAEDRQTINDADNVLHRTNINSTP